MIKKRTLITILLRDLKIYTRFYLQRLKKKPSPLQRVSVFGLYTKT